MRRPDLAGREVRAAQAVLEKRPEDALGPRAVGSGDVRSADAGGRQRALQAVRRVVVELLEFFGRPLPIPDVGLVPDLPIPALDFTLSVSLHRVRHPLGDELAPLVVVLRRMGPTGVDAVVVEARPPIVFVRLRLGRQGLRHEADLDERLHLALDVGVDDAIHDRPVVDRPSGRVFGVGVRRSPLQGVLAVTRRQQVVRADEHGDRTELGQFLEQLLAVGRVGVVRLVVAERTPTSASSARGARWRRRGS